MHFTVYLLWQIRQGWINRYVLLAFASKNVVDIKFIFFNRFPDTHTHTHKQNPFKDNMMMTHDEDMEQCDTSQQKDKSRSVVGF